MVRIRILEAQKHTDPDPQNWLNLVFILVLFAIDLNQICERSKGTNACSAKYRMTLKIREYVIYFWTKSRGDPGKSLLSPICHLLSAKCSICGIFTWHPFITVVETGLACTV
jgi:hypothetical protein